MAKGSRRTEPALRSWTAAVFSEPMMEPRKTPWFQSRAWCTRGMVEGRRPPKRMASMGTPPGSSHSGAITGHWKRGTVNRELGWAAGFCCGSVRSWIQGWPVQSVSAPGGSYPMPSHQTSPSFVRATLVKMVFRSMVRMALGLEAMEVPGATPKKPASGLTACRRPSGASLIQAISSPMVSAFQPGRVGTSMARFVLPQAEGKAAAMYFTRPSGFVILRISMCSASQPSSRASTEAMRRERHFFPSRAFPPYPDPYDQISRVSGKWAMYFWSRGAQGQRPSSLIPASRGRPTEWRQGTNSPSLPSMSRVRFPVWVMRYMLATT